MHTHQSAESKCIPSICRKKMHTHQSQSKCIPISLLKVNAYPLVCHGFFKMEIKNETSSNSWENLTKWSGFPGCKIADFRNILPLNYGFSILIGKLPTQETFPLIDIFNEKYFGEWSQLYEKTTPCPQRRLSTFMEFFEDCWANILIEVSLLQSRKL